MGNSKLFGMISNNYFSNTCVLDREFDEPPANDNDLPNYSVKSASPRDMLPLSE